MVKVEELTIDYDTCRALDGVTFELPAGALLVVLGENGSGKTTLLQALAGVMVPSGGFVRTPAAVVSMAGHRLMLYDELTILENLDWTARLYGLSDGHSRIDALIERAGLSTQARRPVGRLSRGQAQRATLLRALLPDPDLLILDEPFSHLDDESRGLFESWLDERRAAGKTCVLATHDRAAGLRLATHVLTLSAGRAEFFGGRREFAA